MMAEFSKMATINVKKLAQDFAKHDELFGTYAVVWVNNKVYFHVHVKKVFKNDHVFTIKSQIRFFRKLELEPEFFSQNVLLIN